MRLVELDLFRPSGLGQAFFYLDGKVIDISPYRNHRDYLIAHVNDLKLPEYVLEKPSKALFEAYKRGIVRIVWDVGGKWSQGQARKEGNVLYLNGMDKDVWNHMQQIINYPEWAGQIDVVVIEYLDIVNDKPKWDRSDMFRGGAIEALYRGKRPRRELAPPGAIWGGEPMPKQLADSIQLNKQINLANDKPLKDPLKEAVYHLRPVFKTHNDKYIDTNRTSLQGYLTVNYQQLVDAFGPPHEGDGYKTDAEWSVDFGNNKIATIYNYKNGRNYNGPDAPKTEKITDWNVGGKSRDVVDLVKMTLGISEKPMHIIKKSSD